MDLLRLLASEAEDRGFRLFCAASIAGIVNSLLVAIIINASKTAGSNNGNFQLLLFFLITFIALFYSRKYFLVETGNITERLMNSIRLRLVDKIRSTSLPFIENTGKYELYTAITHSTFALTTSSTALISALSAAIMLVFAAGFIAILSFTAFKISLAFIGVGVVYFLWISKKVEKKLAESTRKENEFQGLLDHVFGGFKELKMSRKRSNDLFENFITNISKEARDLKIETNNHLAVMNIFGVSFSYGLIAVIVFLLPIFSSAETKNIPQISSAVLFILGPVSEVVAAVTHYLKCNEAIDNIKKVEKLLDAAKMENTNVSANSGVNLSNFKSLDASGISYTYTNKLVEKKGFSIGPLNFRLNSREIIFIVGGNGSGKSTLLKLLTGLYIPNAGEIRYNNKLVNEAQLQKYRHLFSTIFTDFHLFDRMYGMRKKNKGKLEKWLTELRIDDKTGYEEDRFTNTNLSTGQRKRLALAVSIVERKPILVFDEVAADQDPEFRNHFYTTLLPHLRDLGHSIIAVTHDEHYFHTADKILKMHDGHWTNYKPRT